MLSRKQPYWWCCMHELWEEGVEALQEAREAAQFHNDYEAVRCLDAEIARFYKHYSGQD